MKKKVEKNKRKIALMLVRRNVILWHPITELLGHPVQKNIFCFYSKIVLQTLVKLFLDIIEGIFRF